METWRRLFTTEEAAAAGLTRDALRWGVRTGRWRRLVRSVYASGPEDPSDLDMARGRVRAIAGAAARGHLAGVLHGLDNVDLADHRVSRTALPAEHVVVIGGVPCADGLQTLVDLAGTLSDPLWEQALESALRKELTTVEAVARLLPDLGRSRVPGTARMRRILSLRPPGAPPTGSLLETLMVQLARPLPNLGELVRQHVVRSRYGTFIARVDLAKPTIGFFLELDGQQHAGQPVYDAVRETAVVAATGWLPGRFTWKEVVHLPRTTQRRLVDLADQAARRRGAA